MSLSRNLTLRRWLPVLCPEATRVPSGRVARVMSYYLANARGRANTKHWLDYVAAMEPEALDRIRIGLALAPSGSEEYFSCREIRVLRRRIKTALATARKRWNVPIVGMADDSFYVDLPEGPDGHAVEQDAAAYTSANERARILWGATPVVITQGEPADGAAAAPSGPRRQPKGDC